MEFQCPLCKISMTADDEHVGKVVSCPGCNGRFQIPALPKTSAATAPGTPRPAGGQASSPRGGWPEEDHANVSFWLSFGIGVAITAVFLIALVPFKGKYFSDLFLDRGWVNYAEVFFFVWGCVILAMKWKMAKRQKRAMLLDILPASLGGEINSHTIGSYIDHIYKLPLRLRDSLMVNRIRKGLELFEKRNNNGEVVAVMNAQSDIDSNRVSGSYTLLKVFLWAIPILGFIGTVQGLSVAVSSLSAGSTDPAALKDSINNLTGGLGVAFDTTLLGLVLSMIMSFPMASMQKGEEELLTIIDAFCNEKLLPKLNDSENATTNQLIAQAESLPAFAASLAKAHEQFLRQLEAATGLLAETAVTLKTRLDSHQEVVEKSFTEAVAKLSTQTHDAFTKPTANLEKYFASLSEGIHSLNSALDKLGGEKVVVQKRWFK